MLSLGRNSAWVTGRVGSVVWQMVVSVIAVDSCCDSPSRISFPML